MSEHGFYHPKHGYWQTISDPDEATLAGYPEGTKEVPLKPGADYEWDGDKWVHNPPEPQPEPVPQVVSRFQAKAALLQAGLLEQVEEALQSADPITKLAWAEAVEFHRYSPMIEQWGGMFDLTAEQIDDLFRAAEGIQV